MSWFRDARERARARFAGRLSNSDTLSEAMGQALLAKAELPISDDTKLETLLLACRRTYDPAARRRLAMLLRPYLTGDKQHFARQEKIGWDHYYGDFGQLATHKTLTTSLVLKAPKPNGEKGVLYLSFEYNLMRLLAHHDAAAIFRDYYVVDATSWSPTDFAFMAACAGLSDDPIFVGVSNQADLEQIGVMRPVVEPLPIMASDFTDPAVFTPKPHADRKIDILMVANWSRVKRHWMLFEALKGMPRSLRVVLVGRNGPGRNEQVIREEARLFGAKQDLELHTNLEVHEIAALASDARISTIFTKREGSCVAVSESLFGGAPVAMMEEAIVGSKAYINERTGVLMRHGQGGRSVAGTLTKFLAEADGYTPREWAMEHIAAHLTSERLNHILKSHARATGRPWTEDIVPMCWRYVPRYLRAGDEARMQPAVDELRKQHGVEIELFVGERESIRRKAVAKAAAAAAAGKAAPIEFRPELAASPPPVAPAAPPAQAETPSDPGEKIAQG